MSNEQIIYDEAIASGLYNEEELEQYIAEYGVLPLHTFNGWKALGYIPRKGTHCIIETRLWKHKEKKKEENESEDLVEENKDNFYLTKAFLFDISQVERLEK